MRVNPALLADNASALLAAFVAPAASSPAPAGSPEAALLQSLGLPCQAEQPTEQLTGEVVLSPHPPNPISLSQPAVSVSTEVEKLNNKPTHGLSAGNIVEYLVAHPEVEPKALAKHFGKTFRWLASVITTPAFQEAISPVKHLIVDPFYSASMAERFQALTLQSLDCLTQQLEKPDVSEFTITKAAEIGFKALGMGQGLQQAPVTAVVEVGPEAVADRILAAIATAKERSKKLEVVTDVTPKVP